MKELIEIWKQPFGSDQAATYRALCLFSGIMHLIFHVVFINSVPDVYDPLWQRLVIGIVPLLVFILEMNNSFIKKYFIPICMVMIHLNNVWFIYMMYMNNFLLEYYAGYFIVIIAIGFTFSRLLQLFWFTLSTTIMVSLALLFSTKVHIHPLPSFSIMASIFILAFLLLYLKIEMTKKMEDKNRQLESKNKEVTDSITYAKRIQQAILPSMKSLNESLHNGFILYKPKDIVAGDFYWMEKTEQAIYIAAADCTGHGVPGALVSVICSNALSRSVMEENLRDTGHILDRARELVVNRFSKSGDDVKDGMDISLASFTFNKEGENHFFQWSGANIPLWIINPTRKEWPENTVFLDTNQCGFEIRGDVQPVGKTDKKSPFKTYSFHLEKGDTIYLFTDGYADQFGGERGKKFKTAALKKLLLSIYHKDMHTQREILKKTFEDWKGNLEQTDDVCIIGIRV